MIQDDPVVRIRDLSKTFVLHLQDGLRLPVFDRVNLEIGAGECVVLGGPSGSGKTTLLRAIYANYLADGGEILVRHRGGIVDMVAGSAREILGVRRETMGYVSQFLRVIPRVATRDLVMQPLLEQGVADPEARERAEVMLARLKLPERLWDVPPATFSGGEQQRVNIARSFIRQFPVLLLDEPTASLDAENRARVVELIGEAKAAGTAIAAIFHDQTVRDAVADRIFDVTRYKSAA